MTTAHTPFLRALVGVLSCLLFTGVTTPAWAGGPVVGWGLDDDGQATPPDAVNGIESQVDAGYLHSCAIQISAGQAYSCAIQAGTGSVVCWGSDNSGPGDTAGFGQPSRRNG